MIPLFYKPPSVSTFRARLYNSQGSTTARFRTVRWLPRLGGMERMPQNSHPCAPEKDTSSNDLELERRQSTNLAVISWILEFSWRVTLAFVRVSLYALFLYRDM